jgi:hypothetical protein
MYPFKDQSYLYAVYHAEPLQLVFPGAIPIKRFTAVIYEFS